MVCRILVFAVAYLHQIREHLAQVEGTGDVALDVIRQGAARATPDGAMRTANRTGAAEQLAEQFGVSLGEKLGSGCYGTVYGLQEPGLALKVHDGGDLGGACRGLQPEYSEAEALVGELLPPHAHLRRTLQHAAADVLNGTTPRRVLGQLVEEVGGREATFGVALEDLPRVAADLALALHALHTKVAGFVVLHCDLAPKNVLISGGRAFLLDYGDAVVRPAQDPRFFAPSQEQLCAPTDYTRRNDELAQALGPASNAMRPGTSYTSQVEWRNLAVLVYWLAHGEGPLLYGPQHEGSVWHGALDAPCAAEPEPYRCAAERNLAAWAHPLASWARLLLLEHGTLTEAQVLRHPALPEGLEAEAKRIPVVEPGAVDWARASPGWRYVQDRKALAPADPPAAAAPAEAVNPDPEPRGRTRAEQDRAAPGRPKPVDPWRAVPPVATAALVLVVACLAFRWKDGK